MGKRAIVAGAVLVLVQGVAAGAAAQEPAAEDVAAQVRIQGHTCEDPVSAERDAEASRTGQEAWILHCENATYRVRLTPGMGAAIETISD